MARRTGANNAIRRDNEKKQRRNRKCLESNRDLCQILPCNLSHGDNGGDRLEPLTVPGRSSISATAIFHQQSNCALWDIASNCARKKPACG
jgi:hypothetical protein